MSRNRNLPSAIPPNRPPPEDGTKYRLRDREGSPPTVWGENLTHTEARVLRDRVTAAKKSRNMEIEPMPGPEVDSLDDLSVSTPAPAHVAPPSNLGTNYEVASAMVATTLAADGVISKIPPDHELLVNGQARAVPTRVRKNDVVECFSLAPLAAQVRGAAADAVAQVIRQKRRVPVDVTVKHPAPRTTAAPPDRSMSNRPVVVRLGSPPATPPKPLPSPLRVATLQDGEVMSDDAITDAELPDLAGDLGGGPSDADVEHARRQAEADRTG
jgi:hypothetical protein